MLCIMISIVDSFVLVVVPYLPVYVGPNLDALNTNSSLELCLGQIACLLSLWRAVIFPIIDREEERIVKERESTYKIGSFFS